MQCTHLILSTLLLNDPLCSIKLCFLLAGCFYYLLRLLWHYTVPWFCHTIVVIRKFKIYKSIKLVGPCPLAKFLSLLKACFDLIAGSYSLDMKIQTMGRKIIENLRSNPHSGRSKMFCPFFFHFQILHKKVHIFAYNHIWIFCCKNRISIKTKIFNLFYLISN